MVLDIFCHLFQWKTSKWRVIKRLPIASDYICNSGVDFISAVISAVTRKKREMFFQQKKVISSLMLMLYTVTVVLSVSLGMIIEYHTIVEYIYPWKMFLSIHFISIYTVNMVKGGNMAHCKLERQWQSCSWAARITCNTQHFYGSLWIYQRT